MRKQRHEEAKKRGRKPGHTHYDEPKKTYGHLMTPTAHDWIKSHKQLIETLARDAEKSSKAEELGE